MTDTGLSKFKGDMIRKWNGQLEINGFHEKRIIELEKKLKKMTKKRPEWTYKHQRLVEQRERKEVLKRLARIKPYLRIGESVKINSTIYINEKDGIWVIVYDTV